MQFQPGWQIPLPTWLRVILYTGAPLLFMLLLPILTRIPRAPLRIPTLKRYLQEALIAISIVMAIVLTTVILEYVVSRLSPGNTIVPQKISRMAETSDHLAFFLFVMVTFTLAPLAEEVFFRGFLQNGFRARMPMWLATIGQSAIFGFGHNFGMVHAVGACVMGLILTVLYEWRRTLVAPIMVHAGSNFVSAAVALTWAMLAFAGTPVLGVFCESGPGCDVQDVVPDTPAVFAGIQPGDKIVAFNTEPIRDFSHLIETVRSYQPGDRIPLSIEREGSMLELEVVLRRRGE